jgi:hypothetical protein
MDNVQKVNNFTTSVSTISVTNSSPNAHEWNLINFYVIFKHRGQQIKYINYLFCMQENVILKAIYI